MQQASIGMDHETHSLESPAKERSNHDISRRQSLPDEESPVLDEVFEQGSDDVVALFAFGNDVLSVGRKSSKGSEPGVWREDTQGEAGCGTRR